MLDISAKYGLDISGTTRPIVSVFPLRKFCARRFGVYPSSDAALRMLSAVLSEILPDCVLPVRTLDTVDVENPVLWAIVSSVGFIIMRLSVTFLRKPVLCSCAKIASVLCKNIHFF